ncbi:MAG: exodeoxyribonuclease V subunit beta [Marinospirillum sp.]|uniref:exodeoxyribonuclease V subunit beta n=1 Tax=Marinospirillum sp. TaxID=2183934 RepID=UPI0019EE6B1E|nr:exodeoxyribonuclease V subunit beta [Marinospirillum sp.]MBE0507047.1 exodeoxyribonuclease V subunit beta [Marinospirillum sp.]
MTEQLNPLSFPLKGSRLIEASAGTGKTFTLALLYVRLVLGHGKAGTAFKQPLTPRDILVVTFTEAAAEELRDRIRGRLVEAADYFLQALPDNSEDDPLEQLRCDFDKAQWNHCAWQLQVAAQSMDEARISTIHSWCNRVLVEQAFDTRGLFNRQLVTDINDLLAEVVRDYWRCNFYSLPAEHAALINDEAFKSPDNLQQALKGLLKMGSLGASFKGAPLRVDDLSGHLKAAQEYQAAKAEADRVFEEAKEARLEFENKVKAHWKDNWEAIKTHLLELRSSLNGTSHDSTTEESYNKLLEAIQNWVLGKGAVPGKLKNFAAGAFKFKKGGTFQQEKPLEAFSLLKELFELNLQAQVAVDPPEPPLRAAIVAHALPWVQQTFNQRMKQRAEMGFDDLLIELDRALDPNQASDAAERLAESLRNRFPVAMIDEFQDTDPVQYRIFDRIYDVQQNCEDQGLFMIGDPKQAIYSFRGADIHTYLKAREATTGRHYTLKKNFRSTQGVVDACNALFQYAEDHERAAFRFKQGNSNPIPFIAVEAQGRKETLYLPGTGSEGVSPLNLWYFPPEEADKNEEPKPLSIKSQRQLAAEAAASEIVKWLGAAAKGQAGFGTNGEVEQPLQAADIAILVRTGTEAKAIRKALQTRQIASVYLSDRESVFSSQETKDLLHWLHACANPLDERLVKAALGTNTLNLPLTQLAAWQDDELAWEGQMQSFQQLHWVWQRKGILAMAYQLLQVFDLPARLMQTPDGERSLTNILHLAEWLQQASSELDGEQALIRHLAEHLDAGDEQQLLRLESDAERIKVITIHKSKGLEYPLVLLPFIGSWKEIDGHTTQVPWLQKEGHYQEVAGKKAFGEAWEIANDERISEDMRLLYVALTRARHALWLGVAALQSGRSKTPQVERSAWGYLLNGGRSFPSVHLYESYLQKLAGKSLHINLQDAPAATETLLHPQNQEQLQPARLSPKLNSLYNWWIASYSAIHFQSHAAGEAAGEATEHPEESGGAQHYQDQEPETSKDDQNEQEQRDISIGSSDGENAHEGELSAENVLHRFPAGATWGTVLHTLLEWAAVQEYKDTQGEKIKGFAAVVAGNTDARTQFGAFCKRRRIQPPFIEPLWQWLINFVSNTWQLNALSPVQGQDFGFALKDLKPSQIAVEMEFMVESHWVNAISMDKAVRAQTLSQVERPQAKNNLLNGLLKGFIDLVAEYEGRYFVIDWKSNRLGRQDVDYTQEAMLKQILSHRYDLQYVLYLVALHRLLKARLPDYDYDQHVGGAIYVFLRGTHNTQTQGLFCDKPPKALIEQLDGMLKKTDKAQAEQGANA